MSLTRRDARTPIAYAHGMRRAALLAVALVAALAASEVGCSAAAAPGPPAPRPLTADVGVHDVSFLYPLPAQAQRTSLLGAASAGERGPLLPNDLYGGLPPLDLLTPNLQSYHLFRVVAVRLDPCFPGLGVPDEASCKNQLRLVMQPVVPQVGTQALTTADTALHLFYSLTRVELADILAQLVELRRASGAVDGPVGVHPALAREGVEGAFARGARALLLGHAGRDNLTRITFMALEQVGQAWRFGGFEVEAGALRPMTIPLVGVKEQTFQNLDLKGHTFERAATYPASPSQDDLRLLLDPKALEAAGPAERLVAYRHALRIENPTAHSPDTIDCATCHVASAARRYAELTYGLSATGPERYVHPAGRPLPGATPASTNELRAFGYFGVHPSVSPRVVNETSEVVLRVNATVRTR